MQVNADMIQVGKQLASGRRIDTFDDAHVIASRDPTIVLPFTLEVETASCAEQGREILYPREIVHLESRSSFWNSHVRPPKIKGPIIEDCHTVHTYLEW